MILGGFGISKYIVFYPIILVCQYLIIIAISLIVSSICVYLRDLQHFIGVVIQLLFYASPIVYSENSIPDNFKWILKYNPMTYIINSYRDIFYLQKMPHINSLIILILIGIVLCIISYIVFNKLQKGFAEQL